MGRTGIYRLDGSGGVPVNAFHMRDALFESQAILELVQRPHIPGVFPASKCSISTIRMNPYLYGRSGGFVQESLIGSWVNIEKEEMNMKNLKNLLKLGVVLMVSAFMAVAMVGCATTGELDALRAQANQAMDKANMAMEEAQSAKAMVSNESQKSEAAASGTGKSSDG